MKGRLMERHSLSNAFHLSKLTPRVTVPTYLSPVSTSSLTTVNATSQTATPTTFKTVSPSRTSITPSSATNFATTIITLTSAVSATDGQSLSSGAIGGIVGGLIGGLVVITAIGCIYLKSKERRFFQSSAHDDVMEYSNPSPKEQMSSGNLERTEVRLSGRVQYNP
jgi:hypothetical protein